MLRRRRSTVHRAGAIIHAATIVLLAKLHAKPCEVFSTARVLARPRAYRSRAREEIACVEGHMTSSILFGALGDDEMRTIVESMRRRVVEAGEMIVELGAEATSMFVVTSGSFNCTIPVDGELKNVKTCYTGEIFGELAIIYDRPRAANVVCWDPAVVWELDKKVFWEATMRSERQTRVVQSVFNFVDTDASRKVDKKEVQAALKRMGESIPDGRIDELMLQFDDDGDGELDVLEFTAMLSAWQIRNSALSS